MAQLEHLDRDFLTELEVGCCQHDAHRSLPEDAFDAVLAIDHGPLRRMLVKHATAPTLARKSRRARPPPGVYWIGQLFVSFPTAAVARGWSATGAMSGEFHLLVGIRSLRPERAPV